MLPQSPIVPGGIVVEDLVARGRFAHQRLLRQWSPEDEAGGARGDAADRGADLADRFVDELSGGQRQRVWLADRRWPSRRRSCCSTSRRRSSTSSHQFEVLDLCAELHEEGRTLVAVLHDLNHACRYATELIVMRDGAVVAQGAPGDGR